MSKLFFANTHYELALLGDSVLLSCEHACLQLQLLPLLFMGPTDYVCTTFRMEHPQVYVLGDPIPSDCDEVISWGASAAISQWAKQHGLKYDYPPISLMTTIQSKAFCRDSSSHLLNSWEEVCQWLKDGIFPKVCKQVYSLSGRGHYIVTSPDDSKLRPFLEKEWEHGRVVLGESWLSRWKDFSTQWIVSKEEEIRFLGWTILENTSRGCFRSCTVGRDDVIEMFLEEHKRGTLEFLTKCQQMGYFGPVGVDAFIYDKEHPKLRTLCEANFRYTFGRLTLELQKERHPGKIVSLSYIPRIPNKQGLLSEKFKKQLYLDVLQSIG